MMNKNPEYLGTGWSFPPRFSESGKEVHMTSGAEDVHESLQILLGTRLGERVMRSSYGCELSRFAFEGITNSLTTGLTSLIKQSIVKNEPRVRLENVSISRNKDDLGRIDISISYRIHQTNSRYNMVYPYYINEATQSPVST